MEDKREKEIKIWEYLAETGAKLKSDAYIALGFEMNDLEDCPSCEVACKDEYGRQLCTTCPVYGSWVTSNGSGVVDRCESNGSAFVAWVYADDGHQRKKYSKFVLQSIRDGWEE